MNEIILIGGGGHCTSCIEVIQSSTPYRIAGIIDTAEKIGHKVSGYPIIGCDDDIPVMIQKYRRACLTLGQLADPGPRRRLFHLLRERGAELPTIVADTAKLAAGAVIGTGCFLFHRAFLNASATVGDNCILNTGCLIEHDAVIGDHCHISTGAIINGGCRIGNGVFIGSNAVVIQGIHIADNAVIGAGAVVIRDISVSGTYAGNPARAIRET